MGPTDGLTLSIREKSLPLPEITPDLYFLMYTNNQTTPTELNEFFLPLEIQMIKYLIN
jgi:hypothetical protein